MSRRLQLSKVELSQGLISLVIYVFFSSSPELRHTLLNSYSPAFTPPCLEKLLQVAVVGL